jgi:hypothetical protein
VNEIMVNVAWHHDKIEQYFGDGHRWGVQIGYSYEGVRDHGDIVPKPWARPAACAASRISAAFSTTTTIVLCGDALIDLDIGAACTSTRARAPSPAWSRSMCRWPRCKNYGIVVAEPDGRIQSFQEKPDPADAKSTLASTGIYIFEPGGAGAHPVGQGVRHRLAAVPATGGREAAVLCAEPLFQLDRHRPGQRLLVGAATRAARRGGADEHARARNPPRCVGRAQHLASTGMR